MFQEKKDPKQEPTRDQSVHDELSLIDHQMRVILSVIKGLEAKIASDDSLVCNGEASAPEQVQELHEGSLPPREQLTVELDRGRLLIAPQYEALTKFAQNNGLHIRELLSTINVENGVIVEIKCCLTPRLTTLEGLEHLATVKLVDLGLQPITSLRGLPLQALEHLHLAACDIKGDLSEISRAGNLRTLFISNCEDLASIRGIPTQMLEDLSLYYTPIEDLSYLRGAAQLKKLLINGAPGLTSLAGISVETMEEINVSDCCLTGDLSDLSEAANLKRLVVRNNRGLLSLKGAPTRLLQEIHVSCIHPTDTPSSPMYCRRAFDE